MGRIKTILKKSKVLVILAQKLSKPYYRFLTIISPKLNTKVTYQKAFGKKLNLKNPQTFNEKVLWLKLNNYIHNPLVWKCADKVQVKDYLIEKGFEDIVIPNIGIYNNASEIDWDGLPNKFVIKWNFGAGMNIVCPDKSKLDINATIKQLNQWSKNKYWLNYSEMQYKMYPKKILIEEYLEPKSGKQPEDYKFYCFNGMADCVMVCVGREFGHPKFYYYDKEWNLLPYEDGEELINKNINPNIKKPNNVDDMFAIASKLSEGFPFVRVDLYYLDDRVYFGELTFTPAGGLDSGKFRKIDKLMGEKIKLEAYK